MSLEQMTMLDGAEQRWLKTSRRSRALTPSEARVLERVLLGETNREIAEALRRSEKTVEFHVANIFLKNRVRSRVGLLLSLLEAPFGISFPSAVLPIPTAVPMNDVELLDEA